MISRLSIRGVALVIALGAIGAAPLEADAARNSRSTKTRLTATADESKARGTVKTRVKRGVRISVMKFRKLDRRRRMSVFDESTGAHVDDARTNGRGAAKVRLREDVDESTVLTKIEAVSVSDAESGALHLAAPEADEGLTARSSLLSFIPSNDDFTNWTAWASLHSFEDGGGELVQLHVIPPDPGFPFDSQVDDRFGFAASSLDGNLPFGASTVAELGSRDYRIKDGDGAVVAESRLPPVLLGPPLRESKVSRAWLDRTAGAMDDHPFSDMTLEMKDANGEFQEVATLKHFLREQR